MSVLLVIAAVVAFFAIGRGYFGREPGAAWYGGIDLLALAFFLFLLYLLFAGGPVLH